MNTLNEFIMAERFHYADDDNNRFAFTLGQASRYYDFLLIILNRYVEANKKTLAILEKQRGLMSTQTYKPVPVTAKQWRLIEKSSRLTTLVHLEIESFYLFAKVLLDNIARFLHVYFGQERGIGLKSHNNLTKHHKEYFKTKVLVVPEGLSESIIFLKESVCDYRDDEISHEMTLRRTKGTAWGTSGNAKIVDGILYPRKDDRTAITKELPQLMEDINAYIRLVIKLIEANRAKTRLKLRGKASQE